MYTKSYEIVHSLSVKEWTFFRAYIETQNYYKAWDKIHPESTLAKLDKLHSASRFFNKIKRKLTAFQYADIMEALGVGHTRLIQELNKLLKAKIGIYKKGELIDERPDNHVRAKAVATLASILGVQKNTVEVTGKDGKDLTLNVIVNYGSADNAIKPEV